MYTLHILTEELRGRLRQTFKCRFHSLEDAEREVKRRCENIYRNHEVFIDEEDELNRMVEYFPKMRTTFTIAKA